MINKNEIKTLWKQLADTKTITVTSIIQLCILKAMAAKSEDKVAIAKHFIRKSFTPISNSNKLANGREPFDVLSQWMHNARIDLKYNNDFGLKVCELLSEDEIKQFNDIYAELKPAKILRRYAYFFTRQDISPEYQLVQTAHAALELGTQIGTEAAKDLYFTVCGVRDHHELDDIERVLQTLKLKYVVFREPDIGNEKTSIAVHPIVEHKRGILRSYGLLRFKERGKEVW